MEVEVDPVRLSTFVPEKDYLEINTLGHLEFDGVDTVDLAKQFGTPLYVMSERKILENYHALTKTFSVIYPRAEVAYAYKANPTLAALKLLKEEGAIAEVISTGELFLADLVGTPGSRIVFNGCNKDRKGIRLAIQLEALINVDSFQELNAVEEEAARIGKKARIGIRINPVVKTGTLSVWETAIEESKFGITLSRGLDAYKKAQKLPHLEIVGIQTHIGSQIEDFEPYRVATTRIVDFLGELKKSLGITLQVVDMGGGIAVPFKYVDVPPLEKFAHAILDPFKKALEMHDLGEPTLIIEPGGSIIGTTTILLVTVGMVKREESSKKWAMVDGGANINLRATQGWYVFQCFCCNKMNEKKKEIINIAGPLCYAGDVLAYDRDLPLLEEGDTLALVDCGAYTAAIINRYNSYPAPGIVLLQDGKARMIKQRETLTDLVTGETMHTHI